VHPGAGDAYGLLGEPAEELCGVRDLALRLGDRLAHLQAHQLGVVVGVALQQLEGPAQDLAALARSRTTPVVLHRDRGVQRIEGVALVAIGDLREHAAIGGVIDLEPGT